MKHIVWITAFLTLTFLGDRFFGYFLSQLTYQSQFRYSRLYRGDAKADILLVGNSRGLGFYQPEIEQLTGLNTLNISYNGMPADLANVLVRDHFKKNGAPKLMLVDVTLCDRTDELLVAAFNAYTPYSEALSYIIQQYDKSVYYGGLLSHLYRHNSEVFQRAVNYRHKSDEDWLLDRVISDKMATDTVLKAYKIRVIPEMVEQLKQMVDFAKGQGAEVKLVISPYFPRFAETIKDSFLIPLKNSVEARTGLEVSDYSMSLSETSAFGDYQHANKKGSIQFMKQLFQDKVFSAENVSQERMTENSIVSPMMEEAAQPIFVSHKYNLEKNTPVARSVAKSHKKKAAKTEWISQVDTVMLVQ